MTSINSSQFNPNATPVNLGGTEATSVIQKQEGIAKKQNELPPLGDSKGPDTVAYSRPNPLQPHALNFLVDPSTTDALSADITSLLVLLVKTQNDNRASQRKQWLLQAQNVLQTAASVAEEKKKAALLKFASETVTNGIDLVQNLQSAASSFASAGESAEGGAAISKEADAKFGTDEELEPSSETESSIESEESLSEEGNVEEETSFNEPGVGSSSGKDSSSTTGTKTDTKIKEAAAPKESSETENTEQTEKAPQSKAEADSKSGKTETDSEKKAKSNAESRSKKTEAEKEKLRTRKAEFIANREASLNSRLDRKDKQISGVFGAVGSIGKEAASGLSLASEYASASAEQLKGLEDYQSSLASEQLDYANQLRDNAQKLLETLKSIEQARHQAVSAIVNI